jgi:rubredoxin
MAAALKDALDIMSTLRTCPDCGGLLDAAEPRWTATIDLASARQPDEPVPAAWRCLICGYEDALEQPRGREGVPAVRGEDAA